MEWVRWNVGCCVFSVVVLVWVLVFIGWLVLMCVMD